MKTIPFIIGIELIRMMSPCSEVRDIPNNKDIKTVWTTEAKQRHLGWLIPIEGKNPKDTVLFKPNSSFCIDIKPSCI